jgi:Phage-like element PBSX protein XtrA
MESDIMRLEKVSISLDNGKMELELPMDKSTQNLCIVYSGGTAKVAMLPTHGETKIVTHQGKVKRVRFDEGEDF